MYHGVRHIYLYGDTAGVLRALPHSCRPITAVTSLAVLPRLSRMSSNAPKLSYYPLTPDVVDVLRNVIIEAGLAYIAYGVFFTLASFPYRRARVSTGMQAALTLAAVRILL